MTTHQSSISNNICCKLHKQQDQFFRNTLAHRVSTLRFCYTGSGHNYWLVCRSLQTFGSWFNIWEFVARKGWCFQFGVWVSHRKEQTRHETIHRVPNLKGTNTFIRFIKVYLFGKYNNTTACTKILRTDSVRVILRFRIFVLPSSLRKCKD